MFVHSVATDDPSIIQPISTPTDQRDHWSHTMQGWRQFTPEKASIITGILCPPMHHTQDKNRRIEFNLIQTTINHHFSFNKNHHLILAKKMGRKKSANHCSPTTGWFFPIHSKAFYQKKEANQPTILVKLSYFTNLGFPELRGFLLLFTNHLGKIGRVFGHPKGHSDRSFLHRSHRLRPSPPWVRWNSQAAVFSGRNP